jgi:hypothetical protein
MNMAASRRIDSGAIGGYGWSSRRMKAVRLSLINMPSRVVKHSGKLIVRLAGGSVHQTSP